MMDAMSMLLNVVVIAMVMSFLGYVSSLAYLSVKASRTMERANDWTWKYFLILGAITIALASLLRFLRMEE